MSTHDFGATEGEGVGAENSRNSPERDCDESGGICANMIGVAAISGAVAALAFGYLEHTALAATGAACALAAGLAAKASADSSVRKAAIEARTDLLECALKKRREMQIEKNNHELKMSKIEAITCCFEGCGASFEDSVKLVTHFQECHRGVKCNVEGCEAFLKNSSALDQHIQQCHSGVMLACTVRDCKLFFSSAKDLCSHVSEVHATDL